MNAQDPKQPLGRVVVDLGHRKTQAVRAADRRGLSLKAWLIEAIDAKLKREEEK